MLNRTLLVQYQFGELDIESETRTDLVGQRDDEQNFRVELAGLVLELEGAVVKSSSYTGA
jgi:hypothetical protein